MVFAGGPDEIADRILHLHDLLGHTRPILQMDVGGMPQATFLKSIELLDTGVLPQIRKRASTAHAGLRRGRSDDRNARLAPLPAASYQAHHPNPKEEP
jgi:hypothetical protein